MKNVIVNIVVVVNGGSGANDERRPGVSTANSARSRQHRDQDIAVSFYMASKAPVAQLFELCLAARSGLRSKTDTLALCVPFPQSTRSNHSVFVRYIQALNTYSSEIALGLVPKDLGGSTFLRPACHVSFIFPRQCWYARSSGSFLNATFIRNSRIIYTR